MELFFELLIISVLNLYTTTWETLFLAEQFSDYLSILSIVIVTIGPLILIIRTCVLPYNLTDQQFMDKYGSIFDGLHPRKIENKERLLLLWPILFFMRRVAFVILVILYKEFLWLQLAT